MVVSSSINAPTDAAVYLWMAIATVNNTGETSGGGTSDFTFHYSLSDMPSSSAGSVGDVYFKGDTYTLYRKTSTTQWQTIADFDETGGSGSNHTVLTGNLDMDTIATPGEYSYTKGGNALTNNPADVDDFGLEVIALSGTPGGDIRQWLTHAHLFATITWERPRFEGIWRNWRRVQFVPTDGVIGDVLTKDGSDADDYRWDPPDAGLTADQVTTLVEAFNYLDEDDLRDFIAALGHLTASEVAALIASEEHLTSAQVGTLIANATGGFVTMAQVTSMLNALDTTTQEELNAAIAGANHASVDSLLATNERVTTLENASGGDGSGDTIQLAGVEIRNYWQGNVDVLVNSQLFATGFVVPVAERTGWWLINFGADSNDKTGGEWRRVDVAQLFALPNNQAGDDGNVADILIFNRAFGGDIYLGHTELGQLLVGGTSSETSDSMPLTIRREVYTGGNAPSQAFNFLIVHDSSEAARAGTFAASDVTNRFNAFMNFTPDAAGGTASPLSEATALTNSAVNGQYIFENIENIVSDGSVILHSGVPVDIKCSGGLNIEGSSVPSGVVLGRIARVVLLNGVEISRELSGTFRLRNGKVYIPFEELSYTFIPSMDTPYQGSVVKYILDMVTTNGSHIATTNITYWISPETKEVVTQLNPIVAGAGEGTRKTLLYEGDIDVSDNSTHRVVLSQNYPTSGFHHLQVSVDTAHLVYGADNPGRNILAFPYVDFDRILGLDPMTIAQANTNNWVLRDKVAMYHRGLYPVSGAESPAISSSTPLGVFVGTIMDINGDRIPNELLIGIGAENSLGQALVASDAAPLILELITHNG